MTAEITRQTLIDTLHHTLRKLPKVRAAYLGGSDASGRTDVYSDVDIQVLVTEEAIEDTFTAVFNALSQLAPIDRQYRLATNPARGYEQTFYHLANTPAWLLVDFAIIKVDEPDKLLATERHGTAVILFDHDRLTTPPPFNREAHLAKMNTRRQDLIARFRMFNCFVDKAIHRGDVLDAMATYHAMVMRALVELLKMRYCPDRYDYGMRYADRDLPADVHAKLQTLLFCPDLATLQEHHKTAVVWFEETARQFR